MNFDDSILNGILKISHLLHRKIGILSDNPHFEGITGRRAGILNYIIEASGDHPVLQKELEQKFTIRRSTATQFLQELEKYGYIDRYKSEDDQRQRLIVPTRKAIESHGKVLEGLEKIHSAITAGFSEKDFAAAKVIMDKLLKNLETID